MKTVTILYEYEAKIEVPDDFILDSESEAGLSYTFLETFDPFCLVLTDSDID